MSRVRPDEILAAALTVCVVDLSDLCGKGKHADTVAARTIFVVLCRELTILSYPDISRLMGRTNHSTAVTAVRRYHANPEPLRARLEAVRVLAEAARRHRRKTNKAPELVEDMR